MVTANIPDRLSAIAVLRSEGERLAQFLSELDAEGWERDSACDGWTVADVAAHLAQGNGGAAVALNRARGDDPSPPEGQRLLDPGERASELTAERAIAYRSDMEPAQTLQAYEDGCARLLQAVNELQAEDWEKDSFHRRGIIPVHENLTRRIQETAIHGWDIRSAFDPAAELSEAAAALIVNVAHRWLNACFVPLSDSEAARFRFEVSGSAAFSQDVVLAENSFRIEPAEDTPADVTFRCNASAYVLLIYGRLDLSSGETPAQLAFDGPLEKVLRFTEAFKGY